MKTVKKNISRLRALSGLLLYHSVVPSSTSKWPSESFLGFLDFEIFFFKVEILAVFWNLKKSYIHQISLSSTSHLNVKKRLLLLSEAFNKFFRRLVVDLIHQVHKKNILLLFDYENGRSILTLKNSPKRGKISILKKIYLENGKSAGPQNLLVCSTHGCYKLVNL